MKTKRFSLSSGAVLPCVALFLLGLLLGGVVVGQIAKNQVGPSNPVEKGGRGAGVSAAVFAGANRLTPVVTATQKVLPAVVSITVTQIQVMRDPFFDDFFNGFFVPDLRSRYREVKSIGSGVIFDSLGHILTNQHVVAGASQIMVNLPDGREFSGELVGSDPITDLAVVRVLGKNLPMAILGNSSDLMLGETVIALGNPFGYLMSDANPSVTTGVISALHRDFSANPEDPNVRYLDMIQTDAAINPGNSGGPLANILGEVIGINTFIMSPNKGSVGIGFALPINKAKKAANELIRFGARNQYKTGLKVQDMNAVLAQSLGFGRDVSGVVVVQVEKNSAAARAGLAVGDVITAVNDEIIRNTEDVQLAFSAFFADDVVTLTVLRENGRIKRKVPLQLEAGKH